MTSQQKTERRLNRPITCEAGDRSLRTAMAHHSFGVDEEGRPKSQRSEALGVMQHLSLGAGFWRAIYGIEGSDPGKFTLVELQRAAHPRFEGPRLRSTVIWEG